MTTTLESGIRELTRPVNGQYPRPWMTNLTHPEQANVFVVGKNQRNGYPAEMVGEQSRHVDALFNRNGETCRGLYNEVTAGRPSRTRLNLDRLKQHLACADVDRVFETNVICYSTGMSADLARAIHHDGRECGRQIFRFLLRVIKPPILITHGTSTRKELEKILGAELAPLPDHTTENIRKARLEGLSYNPTVYCIPSLAPPAFNSWGRWSEDYLNKLAADVAAELKR